MVLYIFVSHHTSILVKDNYVLLSASALNFLQYVVLSDVF